ncbi:O-antigen ligase family protein [Patescibacteria group bacterium]|nr:O-antigen ligase family protein [Patescibacteria group bacterium]
MRIPKLKLVPSLVFAIKALMMAVLFLPLFLHSQFFFPFIVPKNVAFRLFVEVALGLYFILMMVDSSYKPRFNKLTISVIIFFAVTFIASIFGVDFSYSFWGDYERMGGIFHNLHLLAYFFILINVFKQKKDWYQFFAFTVMIAMVACGLGLSQKWEVKQLIKSSGGARLTGPIGNAAFFAGYLLLHVFLALYFLFKRGRFPAKFYAYNVLAFNVFFVVFEIYKRAIGQYSFLTVIFSHGKLLTFFIIFDVIAIYLFLVDYYDIVSKIKNKVGKYLIANTPLVIIVSIFLYVIYNTQTRGALLSIWVSAVVLLTIGFYTVSDNKSKTLFSILTLGLVNKDKRKQKVLLAVLIVIVLFSQVLLYLVKDTSFVPTERTLSRLSSFVTLIAFYLSVFFILIISFYFEKVKSFKIVLAGLIFLIVASPIFLFLARDASWVQGVPVLDTFANITSTKAITIESRLLTWRTSWEGIMDRPVFGWGLENYEILFNKYFPVEIFKDNGSRVWFDRAHNIIFDVTATTGIVGLISYLSIFIIAIYYLLKKYKKERDVSTSLFLIVLLFAYFLQNLFVFDTLNSEIIIYLILAFIVFLVSQNSHQTEILEQVKPKKVNLLLIILVFTPLLILIYGVNIRTLQANHMVFESIIAQKENDQVVYKKDIIIKLIDASEIVPIGKYEIREQLITYINSLLRSENIAKEDVLEGLEIAIIEAKKTIDDRSNDIRAYLYLANLYNGSVEYDNSHPEKTIDLLEDVIYLSPNRTSVYFELGQAYLFLSDFENAIINFKKGVDLATWVVDSHLTMAEVYIISEKYEQALSEIDIVRQSFGNNDITSVQAQLFKIAEMFIRKDKKNEAITIIEELFFWAPTNLDYLSSLTQLYAQTGEIEKAKETANKIIEIDPMAKDQVEAFFNTLSDSN